MKAIKYLAMLAAGLLVSVSCNGNKSQNRLTSEDSTKNTTAQAATAKKDGKVLIVFFSHAGENYSVGNIKVGNTKLVADEIQKVTGGDVFEIVPEKNYDMPYNQLTEEAQKEAENNELPAFKGEVKDISKYDTIFVGGPVWWGTYPRVMFTFFKKYDLSGKTIIPFTTHEGSGLGSVVEDLKGQYTNATVTDGFSIAGHSVRGGMDKVDKWLKGLGY